MGVIRNTASMQIRGRVGNTTYYVEGGRQIARVSQNGSNYGESASRTEKQQFQRGKWGNLVNFYKVSKSWMKKAFESKSRTQSDYNRFMQLNTPNARIYLTKNMYANGGCVADAFRISEGSLRPIEVLPSGDAWCTDIKLEWGIISTDDTVADITRDLLDNNSNLREGMQISFISYQQRLSPDGIPTLICTAYEVTLDLANNNPWMDYLPSFCSAFVDGYLGTSNQISTGAFAYVLSETRNGKTSVSTQTLITKNDTLISEFSSKDAIARSIASYGIDEDVFLTSGSYPKQPTQQPVYISSVLVGPADSSQVTLLAGDLAQLIDDLWVGSANPKLVISGRYTNVTGVNIWDDKGARHGASYSKNTDGSISLVSKPSYVSGLKCVRIDAILDDMTISIEFVNE